MASLRWCGLLLLVLLITQQALLADAASTQKIKKIVVLMEENRSYDQMFGWYPVGNGLKGTEYNMLNSSDPSSHRVYINKAGPTVGPCDPDHGTPATTAKIFGLEAAEKGDTKNPVMSGFVEWELKRGNAATNYCEVMSMLTPAHVPIMLSLASEFAFFDRLFAAHPGPTWPNRLFTLSATSAGSTETGHWYHDELGQLFPQKTIFDQLTAEGMTWRNYYNDTPWELMLAATTHNPENLVSMEQFYEDVKNGNLPDFSWINPRSGINVTTMQGSNDQHPDHDISLGERFYKDVYEALRASPQWNETLFIVTYDEHGGFYDHVSPPSNVPPPNDGEKSYPDLGFTFDRLGVRLPTVLISPWIPKGQVISSPPAAQKPANNSEYTLTSIMATVRKLLNMKSGPLTDRDAWSATFEQVLSLDEPRTDCPMHLPDANPPTPGYSAEAELTLPINGLQEDIMRMHATALGVDYPHHIKEQGKMSEWVRDHFQMHKEKTARWKQSKVDSGYRLVVRASGDTGPGFVNGSAGSGWSINKASTVKFMTISLLKIANVCLDYTTPKPVPGGLVNVSDCYPSSNPQTNRDPGQQWIWANDATIRPYADQTLCLTNNMWNGDDNVYVLPCKGVVQQNWGYNGPAPGNGDSGAIYFGNAGNLGVIPK